MSCCSMRARLWAPVSSCHCGNRARRGNRRPTNTCKQRNKTPVRVAGGGTCLRDFDSGPKPFPAEHPGAGVGGSSAVK